MWSRGAPGGLVFLPAIALVLAAGPTAAGAQQRAVRLDALGLDTALWVIPGLRGPPPPLGSETPPPAPTILLGMARIPVSRLLPRPEAPAPPSLPGRLALSFATVALRLGAFGRTVSLADIPVPPPPSLPPALAADTLRFRNELADLAFSLRGSGQLGGDWTRYRPCDEAVQTTCEVSLLPRLSPDLRFAALAGGTIVERLEVDVDYDQTREFQGANRVNIRYQGRTGELLQRLDLGDVDFGLPPSHFLSGAVPAGNFGFQAAMRAGPVDLSSVWAQQNGEVTSRRFRLEESGRGHARSDTLVIDDADYVKGQFFFLVDPRALAGAPHLDALSLARSDAPAALLPGAEPIQLYRSESGAFARQQIEGYIQADAVAASGPDTVTESAWFRYLQPGLDFVVHPSGLWIALRTPLAADEALAVTYVTESGDTIGSYNPEGDYLRGRRPRLRLLRATSAEHQPGRPTWPHEMRQIYRVSAAAEIDAESVELAISLGEESAGRTFARRPGGEDITWLRLFGLDEEAPVDRIDPSQIYHPALESFEDQPPVSGAFVVFPTLEPFAEPPPLASHGIGADEAARILGASRNRRIYRDPDPFERDNGGVFRLNLVYEARGGGPASSFALGAVGIREGTERVNLEGRPLVRGVDYRIDYDLGELVLTDPGALLAANPGRVLNVSWEQRSFFRVAPSSVFGLNARYEMGEYGTANVVGLYQSESALLRRPRLGLEAGAVWLGGTHLTLDLDAPLLTRALGAVAAIQPGERSSVHITGEAAVSVPEPNRQGAVYVDDFDGQNSRSLSLRNRDWRRGSRPAWRDGAETVLPAHLSEGSLAALSWQHAWIRQDVAGDSLGVFEGFNPADIDQRIRVTGSALRDPGLFVRFRPPSGDREGPGGWSSITTVLSPTGTDLTRSDFIEFYARDGEFLTLVLDLGTVSEDAFFVDTAGAANGIKPTVHIPWGQGVLDQEADPRRGEVWGRVTDGRGVWDESCFAERGRIYPLGDPNANCTRGNGHPDTEDLDEDGNLDTLERYRRFVIPLDGSSRYLVRDRHETGTAFRLYRVPIKGLAGIDVGGRIGDAELRAVRHLRLTVTGRRNDAFALTRMAIVGSTWIKRSATGVLEGLGGDTASVQGRLEVGPVSLLTAGDAYASPPGVIEQLDDPTAAFGGQGVEFNERSLAIAFDDVAPGDRVEVYNRFPQRPRDFLSYREARLWAAAARGDFGLAVPAYFFLKVGTDDSNFYLFRTRLAPVANPGAVREAEWLPQIVINFDEWLRLRREAEEELIRQPRLPSDPPLVLWSQDSTHAVFLQDRGRAPNLASVREIGIGVHNETGAPFSGEIWIDELRLARGIRDAGVASALDAELLGGEFLQARASWRGRGGYFRRLRTEPTFQNDRSLNVHTTLQLGRLAPGNWGLEAPLTVSHEREAQTPIFLRNSDVRATALQGVREPGFSRTRVDIALRRAPPEGAGGIPGRLELRAGVVRSSLNTITTESEGEGVDGFLSYALEPRRREVAIFPGFLGTLARWLLPGFLEGRVADARLRWTPESVGLESELLGRELGIYRFDRIIRTGGDIFVEPTEAPRRRLSQTARLALRPVESVTATAELLSGRDFLDVERLSSDAATRELLGAERLRAAGMDFGWEVDRHLRTRLALRPRLPEWARAGVDVTTIHLSRRNADLVAPAPPAGAPALLRNVDGQRNLTASLALDPSRLVGASLLRNGHPDGAPGWWTRAFEPLSVTVASGVTSRFDRDAIEPGWVHELGWGGRERFLAIGPDTASTFSERDRATVRGGLRLPASAIVRVGYDRSLTETLDTRSDRRTGRTVWPDLNASVGRVPLPPLLAAAVERLSLSWGLRREERRLEFGAGSFQDRYREDREQPFSVTAALVRGITVAYRGRVSRGDARDPTGDTRRTAATHSLAGSARFRSPLGAFRDRGAPLRLTVDLRYGDERQCRVTSHESACVAFIDQLERDASLSVDSSVRDFELGVRIRYLDRRSFVGLRAGSTQFQLNVFGRFLLTPAALQGGSTPPVRDR